jgi:PHD/YefM family antitoxin component YafN of YafNO toxin-antitoxin module
MSVLKISCTFLKQNLNSILEKIDKNKEVYFITRKHHPDVVIMSKENYQALTKNYNPK